MQQLLNFFFKNRSLLLFLLLLCLSLGLNINSQDYHKSKFFNSSAVVSGSVHSLFSNIGNYLNLKKENTVLLKENNRLKTLEFKLFESDSSVAIQKNNYKLTPAIVIKNTYAFPKNYLTLNKGQEDLLREDLGVITSKGVVGIIDKTSSKYARVISMLNIVLSKPPHIFQAPYTFLFSWMGSSFHFLL